MPPVPLDSRTVRFNRIVEQNLDAAWRVARRCGVPLDQLDDVVQEVFIILCRRLDEVVVGRERAFVASTAVRVAANCLRGVRRRLEDPLLEPEDIASASGEPMQEAQAARRQGLELLEHALARMSEAQREVFVLTELEQLTAREIGNQLQLDEAAVVSRLRRARESFKEFCEERQHASADNSFVKPGVVFDA